MTCALAHVNFFCVILQLEMLYDRQVGGKLPPAVVRCCLQKIGAYKWQVVGK